MPLPFVDQPTSQDGLGRGPLVAAIRKLLSKDHAGGMTIGIFAGWGEGKSSVLKMLEAGLKSDTAPQTVWFEAWPYGDDAEALWRALLLKVLDQLPQKEADARHLKDTLFRSVTTREKLDVSFNWRALGPTLVRTSLAAASLVVPLPKAAIEQFQKALGDGSDGKAIADFLQRDEIERFEAQVRAPDQFRDILTRVLTSHGYGNAKRLVVLVDDLDRCLPHVALAVLESIKVFLDLPGLTFILAMDPKLIDLAVRDRYEQYDGALVGQYLDKIVQLPLYLPPPSGEDLKTLAGEWWKNHCPDINSSCVELVVTGCPPVARMLIRTLGVLSLAIAAAQDGKNISPEDVSRLAILIVLRVNYIEVFERLQKEGLRFLHGLEQNKITDVPECVAGMARLRTIWRGVDQAGLERILRYVKIAAV